MLRLRKHCSCVAPSVSILACKVTTLAEEMQMKRGENKLEHTYCAVSIKVSQWSDWGLM